jgi:hypothetical protein
LEIHAAQQVCEAGVGAHEMKRSGPKLRRFADKVGRIIRAARAFVRGYLRIWAYRTRSVYNGVGEV